MDKAYSHVEPNIRANSASEPRAWSHELVSYETHFAYSELIKQATFGARVSATWRFAVSLIPLLIKRLIRYEMIPLELRKASSFDEKVGLAKIALKNMLRLGRRGSKTTRAADDNEIARRLVSDGCAVATVSPSRFEELEKLAHPQFDALEKRRDASSRGQTRAFDESRGSVDKRVAGEELFRAIQSVFEDAGVLSAVETYLGRPVRIVDVNPQINDSTDGFWREVFADLKIPSIPGAAYFHRDASGGDLKAIIYFTDVGPENGPFTYVLGSNKMSVSKFDDLICEANDHNGLSSTDIAARKSFAALPARLRQKCAFGNDVIDNSDLARWIGENSWSIEAPKGSIVLFDTKGVHRGGMVKTGQRRVITCVIG
ncbi:MAG: phytanoyl-CoA dioxygenase family protein [Rhizobium sp.]|nr:phytanoyl-CoA dioxygenase family protein [Rhizobium sp.]MDM8013346.1 phytanoyl-CoA dioxygenase family protein [Rhizobium sp.]